MESWFKIFLVSILGFCVLMGAFCIIWPLTHQGEISTGVPDDPVIQTPEPEPAKPDPEPEPEPEPDPEPIEIPAYQPQAPAVLSAGERRAQALLRTMELEEKVYQLFIVTPEALTGVDTATLAGDATREALSEKPVGGLIYSSKNLLNREQVQALLEATQSYSRKPLLLAVDEEGGMVSRIGSNPDVGTISFGNMGDYGDRGDPQAVREVGEKTGQELLDLGFNVNFAPVADVLTNPGNTVIGRRAFSSDPKTAADMVRAMVEGMESVGCPSTLKHFPGHGDTTGDTHEGPTATRRSLTNMRECEFLPFQAGIEAGAPLVMVGHFAAPLLTGDDEPVCFSRVVTTDLLRGELGFSGVIVTDALNMNAITDSYSSAEAAVKALEAGADLLLMPEDLDQAVQGVLDALRDGTLSEERIDESVGRILALKYKYKMNQ